MKLPKLHLRDLFWLVLVCAVAVAWWMERAPLRRKEQQLDAIIQRYSAIVEKAQWIADNTTKLSE